MTLRALVLGTLLLASWSAMAQASVDERLLGLSDQALMHELPDAIKIARPTTGPHGSRALWMLPRSELGGLDFQATFYFRGNALERIEQRKRAPADQCGAAFAAVLAALEARYGNGIYSDAGNPNHEQSQSAAWVTDTVRVMAYRLASAPQCDLLVAMEPRAQRDPTDL